MAKNRLSTSFSAAEVDALITILGTSSQTTADLVLRSDVGKNLRAKFARMRLRMVDKAKAVPPSGKSKKCVHGLRTRTCFVCSVKDE